MIPTWLLFGLPTAAVVVRMGMMAMFVLLPSEVLKPAELDRAGNRAIILPLAGFSFSALLALVVLDATRVSGLRVPILLLLASFLAFYSSLNLQSYKIRRWEDQLGTALKEAGSGWLLFSVVAVVQSSPAGVGFTRVVALPAIAVWVIDFGVRILIDYHYLRDYQEVK
jgi:hypothetical protein